MIVVRLGFYSSVMLPVFINSAACAAERHPVIRAKGK